MPSNPNQTPAEPRKSRKILDEVQQAMREKLSDAADRIDLAAAEDPVLDPIGQNPVPMDIGTEANEKQADLTIGNDLSGGTTDAPPQECD